MMENQFINLTTYFFREKKRQDARSALKGVRMNRRFELQMKSRTQNS